MSNETQDGLVISGANRVTFIGPFAVQDGEPMRGAHLRRSFIVHFSDGGWHMESACRGLRINDEVTK